LLTLVEFRSIVGTIHLALAFLVAFVAAVQMAADPPVRTAIATGLLSVVLALTAIALRPSTDGAAGDGNRDRQDAAQSGQRPYPAQWAAPPHQGMPPAPGQSGPFGGAPPQQPQQPWQPSGQ
jgi:hypothetical protein